MKATPSTSWPQRFGTFALLLLALAFVLRSFALFSANALPLQLVLGSSYWPLAAGLLCALIAGVLALRAEWRRAQSGEAQALASLRWGCTALIAGWLGFLFLVDPFQRLWFDLGLGLVAGGYSAFVLLMGILGRRSPRAAFCVDLVSFSLLAGLLGLEVSLRAWAGAYPSPMFARVGGGPSELVQRFCCKPGEVRFGFPCNSAGYYDEEFYRKQPGEPTRVVSIGDSFSVGTVPHAWHYTTLLEEQSALSQERSRLRVDNLGVAGIGPREYLSLLVEEALPLDPDLILISLFVGNDLSVEDVLGDLPDSGLRAWLQRDQVLLAVFPDRVRRLQKEQARLSGRAASQARGAAGGDAQPSMDRSAASQAFPWVLDPLLEEPSLAPETFHNIELGRALEICAQDPPSLQLMKDCLLQAKRAAGDVPLAVMLIPDEFQVEQELWDSISASAKRPLERDRPQRLLMAWFATSGLPVLDLLPVLRDVPPLKDGKRHLYHAFDTHFNARGNEAAAKALHSFLRKLVDAAR